MKRVFLFLGVLAAAQAPVEYLVAPASETNIRNSEADALVLRDGRVLLAWTDFTAAKGSDWAPAQISARISKDRGDSFGEKFTLQENIGAMNVMEPDLLRLRSGKVLFLFCRKNSEADCAPMVRLSTDDARTFSAPRPMAITPSPSYTGFNHDRAIQVRGGRILMPVFFTADYRVDPHIRSRVYYSDDEGATWLPGETILDLPETKSGAQEPGVVELKDGSILLWVRTEKGKIYKAHSRDRGRTFGPLSPMTVDSPLSPQSIKRHPKTGDLILIWNNTTERRRFPLTAAVSKDDGETWTHIRNLDESPGHTFNYTSIEWLRDRALFTYAIRRDAGWSLKLKAVPLDWFYKP
ncbi:MAG: exo-alpha-sialidase [Acidobacteria bacterium]|nr:exo-alpha-sialidase [Acidobacteriota bacterium]